MQLCSNNPLECNQSARHLQNLKNPWSCRLNEWPCYYLGWENKLLFLCFIVFCISLLVTNPNSFHIKQARKLYSLASHNSRLLKHTVHMVHFYSWFNMQVMHPEKTFKNSSSFVTILPALSVEVPDIWRRDISWSWIIILRERSRLSWLLQLDVSLVWEHLLHTPWNGTC